MEVDAAADKIASEAVVDACTPSDDLAADASPSEPAESLEKDDVLMETQSDSARIPQPDEMKSADGDASSDAVDAENTGDTSAASAMRRCRVCGGESSEGDVVRVCEDCQIPVHARCYGDTRPQDATTTAKTHDQPQRAEDASDTDASSAAAAGWKCDCCLHEVGSVQDLTCVFCEQHSHGYLMKCVDTRNWKPQSAPIRCDEERSATKAFGHLLCTRWDPHLLNTTHRSDRVDEARNFHAAGQEKGDANSDATATTADAAEKEDRNAKNAAVAMGSASTESRSVEGCVADTLDAFPAACCFCQSSCGIRIKCQRLNCSLFFHAMCAHQQNGHLEIRSSSSSSLVQYHGYCARHRENTDDAADVLGKLLSKPIAGLIGRDVVGKLQTIKRRIEAESYSSINAFFRAVATVLVDLCKKGLKASKTDPPVYNMKHLQALQLFLDHIPQLQVVYAGASGGRQTLAEVVDDEELFKHVQKTFNPPKYLGKYAGPMSQVHKCQVCAQPFHERQHLFYCVNETTPHLQHWKCTKRRSNSREREKLSAKMAASGSAKKKLTSISLVQSGQWREIKLPKALPGVSDGIICGICRCDVNAHGLIASRKEGKRAEFEKKKSNFVQGGCFLNPVEQKPASNAAKTANGRPPVAPKPEPRVAAKSTGSERNRGSKRSSSSASDASAKANSLAAVSAESVNAAPVLGPPKMERINVQRTTKWLACTAQIIRLAGTIAKLSRAIAVPSSTPDTPGAPDTAAQPEANDSDAKAEKPETSSAVEPVAEEASSVAQPPCIPPAQPDPRSEITRLSAAIDGYFEEAMRIVRPFDPYVLNKLETAQGYLRSRNGPAVAVLRMIAQEYTRFIYVKHTRAVEKAVNEKRKREEQEAQVQRELERKRLDRDAELALKSQMLAMRKKQRKHVKLG